jgi:hypothetical protein
MSEGDSIFVPVAQQDAAHCDLASPMENSVSMIFDESFP